ncbi:MAG: DUF4190 domain-containing protein [Christensenella sp.]|nr:DUF4190 domain-containing protein [Christensenella sp.]
MICKRCEQTYSDALTMCPYCGAPKEAGQEQPSNNAESGYGETQPQGTPPVYGQQYGQSAYGQQYGQPQYYAPVPVKVKGASASLICGIIGFILCWIPFVGLALNIIAIALSASSKKYGQSGIATAGLVLGILGLIVSIIVSVVMLFAFAAIGAIAGIGSGIATVLS